MAIHAQNTDSGSPQKIHVRKQTLRAALAVRNVFEDDLSAHASEIQTHTAKLSGEVAITFQRGDELATHPELKDFSEDVRGYEQMADFLKKYVQRTEQLQNFFQGFATSPDFDEHFLEFLQTHGYIDTANFHEAAGVIRLDNIDDLLEQVDHKLVLLAHLQQLVGRHLEHLRAAEHQSQTKLTKERLEAFLKHYATVGSCRAPGTADYGELGIDGFKQLLEELKSAGVVDNIEVAFEKDETTITLIRFEMLVDATDEKVTALLASLDGEREKKAESTPTSLEPIAYREESRTKGTYGTLDTSKFSTEHVVTTRHSGNAQILEQWFNDTIQGKPLLLGNIEVEDLCVFGGCLFVTDESNQSGISMKNGLQKLGIDNQYVVRGYCGSRLLFIDPKTGKVFQKTSSSEVNPWTFQEIDFLVLIKPADEQSFPSSPEESPPEQVANKLLEFLIRSPSIQSLTHLGTGSDDREDFSRASDAKKRRILLQLLLEWCGKAILGLHYSRLSLSQKIAWNLLEDFFVQQKLCDITEEASGKHIAFTRRYTYDTEKAMLLLLKQAYLDDYGQETSDQSFSEMMQEIANSHLSPDKTPEQFLEDMKHAIDLLIGNTPRDAMPSSYQYLISYFYGKHMLEDGLGAGYYTSLHMVFFAARKEWLEGAGGAQVIQKIKENQEERSGEKGRLTNKRDDAQKCFAALFSIEGLHRDGGMSDEELRRLLLGKGIVPAEEDLEAFETFCRDFYRANRVYFQETIAAAGGLKNMEERYTEFGKDKYASLEEYLREDPPSSSINQLEALGERAVIYLGASYDISSHTVIFPEDPSLLELLKFYQQACHDPRTGIFKPDRDKTDGSYEWHPFIPKSIGALAGKTTTMYPDDRQEIDTFIETYAREGVDVEQPAPRTPIDFTAVAKQALQDGQPLAADRLVGVDDEETKRHMRLFVGTVCDASPVAVAHHFIEHLLSAYKSLRPDVRVAMQHDNVVIEQQSTLGSIIYFKSPHKTYADIDFETYANKIDPKMFEATTLILSQKGNTTPLILSINLSITQDRASLILRYLERLGICLPPDRTMIGAQAVDRLAHLHVYPLESIWSTMPAPAPKDDDPLEETVDIEGIEGYKEAAKKLQCGTLSEERTAHKDAVISLIDEFDKKWLYRVGEVADEGIIYVKSDPAHSPPYRLYVKRSGETRSSQVPDGDPIRAKVQADKTIRDRIDTQCMLTDNLPSLLESDFFPDLYLGIEIFSYCKDLSITIPAFGIDYQSYLMCFAKLYDTPTEFKHVMIRLLKSQNGVWNDLESVSAYVLKTLLVFLKTQDEFERFERHIQGILSYSQIKKVWDEVKGAWREADEEEETIERHERLDEAARLVVQSNHVSERMLMNRLLINTTEAQTLLQQLSDLGIIEEQSPTDRIVIVELPELAPDASDFVDYHPIFLDFLHQRQTDHATGNALTNREDRLAAHPLEGDDYEPLDLELLRIGQHPLRKQLQGERLDTMEQGYASWVDALHRFYARMTDTDDARSKIDHLISTVSAEGGIQDFYVVQYLIDDIHENDFSDPRERQVFQRLGVQAFAAFHESVQDALVREAKAHANTYEEGTQRIDEYATTYIERYCDGLEAVRFEQMWKEAGFDNETFRESFIAVLEPGVELPHLGHTYAAQQDMDFDLLTQEACFAVFDKIYANLCELAPGVTDDAQLLPLFAAELGDDETPLTRYEQVFGRYRYKILSVKKRVWHANIQNMLAEMQHFKQARQGQTVGTKAKLVGILLDGALIEPIRDPIVRLRKKLNGKFLDSQWQELSGSQIEIGDRGHQLGCTELRMDVLPEHTGKLVLRARINNRVYTFDVVGQKHDPLLPVQQLMKKIESSHDLVGDAAQTRQQKAFLMMKAATGALALLCHGQGGLIYQHGGDHRQYEVCYEDGHIVIYERKVNQRDEVIYTPIFDEGDFSPGADMRLNTLLRHVQKVSEHAERALHTKHLVNEAAAKAVKGSKKELMIAPKKDRRKIEKSQATTKAEKARKFLGQTLMTERYTIEEETVQQGKRTKKQQKLNLTKEHEGLGAFTFTYQQTPTSPRLLYAVITEGSSTYVYQIHAAGADGQYIIDKTYQGIGVLWEQTSCDRKLLTAYTEALFANYFAQDRIKDTQKTFIFQGDDSRYYTISSSNAHPGYKIQYIVDETMTSEIYKQISTDTPVWTSAYILPKKASRSGDIATESVVKRAKPRRALVVDGYTYEKSNRGRPLFNLDYLDDASITLTDHTSIVGSTSTLRSLIAVMNEAVK